MKYKACSLEEMFPRKKRGNKRHRIAKIKTFKVVKSSIREPHNIL